MKKEKKRKKRHCFVKYKNIFIFFGIEINRTIFFGICK